MLLWAREIIVLNRCNIFLSPTLRLEPRVINLVYCVMNYAVWLEMEYVGLFLQNRRSGIARSVQSSWSIENDRLFKCCNRTHIAKLLLRNNNVFTFVTAQSRRSISCHDLCPVHFEDATNLLANEEDFRLLVMTADSDISNLTRSASFQSQSSYHFEKKVLSSYCNIQERVMRLREVNRAGAAIFHYSPNFTL